MIEYLVYCCDTTQSTARTTRSWFSAAIPGACLMPVKHLDCCMECFASPLNCRYSTFCMFPDTALCLARWKLSETSLQKRDRSRRIVVDALIYKMAVKMNLLLSQANKNRKPLSFVVIIPEWDQTDGMNLTTLNTYGII